MDLLLGIKRKCVQLKSSFHIESSFNVMLMGLIASIICVFCPLGWLSSTRMIQTRHMATTYICLAMFFFFLIMAVGTLITEKCLITSVQKGNGIFIFLALVIGLFYIPNNQHSTLRLLCTFASLLGGFFFILLQPVLLIDFIVSRITPWMKRLSETNVTFHSWSLTLSVIGYLLCSVTVAYIASSLNRLNEKTGLDSCSSLVPLIIQFNLASSQSSLGVYIILMLFWILRYLRSAILIANSFAFYILLVTWSAISNASDLGCQQQLAFTWKEGWNLHVQLFLQLLIWLISVVYLKIRIDDLDYLHALMPNEYVGTLKRYQSSTFLLGYAFAGLHLMMVLTDFIRLTAGGEIIGQILPSYYGIYNELLFWMKMIALALCIFLYFLFLIIFTVRSIVKLFG